MIPPLRVELALFLIVAALADRRTGRVPNTLTLPMMALGALFSVLGYRAAWFLLPWAVIYALWRLGAYGGGDAKLLMALFAFAPAPAYSKLALCLAASMGLAGLMSGWKQYGGLLPFLVGVGNVLSGAVSRRELAASARPFTWAFALGGLCYLIVL